MINGEGGRIAEENRVDYVMDMTETMGTVWLGLTLNCCRCHDHKFDPLTQQEYYQLFAFFNQTPVDGGGGNAQTAPVLTAFSAEQRAELARLDAERQPIQQQLEARVTALADDQPAWEQARRAELEAQPWRPLTPTTAQADRATLEILPDGSVLAKGTNPDTDAYTVTLTPTGGSVAVPAPRSPPARIA